MGTSCKTPDISREDRKLYYEAFRQCPDKKEEVERLRQALKKAAESKPRYSTFFI